MEERQNSAKEKVEKLSAETEEIKAQDRVKKARQKLNAKKSAQAKKKKAEQVKRASKEKKAKAKEQLKLQKQAERQERKELKKQKLESFKAEKLKLKQEKELQKAQIKREKLEHKAKAKADKRQKRAERSKRRSSKGVGGWIAAVVSLGLSSLILGALLVVNVFGGIKDFPQNMANYNFSQSYEELVDYNQNIDTNLSKFFVSNSTKEQQRLLVKVAQESALAEESLQKLPITLEAKGSTSKIINQIGDYSLYLNNKLIDGLSITDEEREDLYRLYEYNKEIKQTLSEISEGMANGMRIDKLFKEDNIGGKLFMQLEEKSVTYPQLIYDGPFSDGLQTVEVKGLSGEEISSREAEEIFKGVFAGYELNAVEMVGEFNGKIKCYSVRAMDKLGDEVYAEISKVGGKVIMFDYNKTCLAEEEVYTAQECEELGLKYLAKLGVKNMQAVWVEETQGYVTINYACEQGGVILYPDLIKLNICKKEGVVFGMEATNYYLNHTQRDIANAKISSATAKAKISESLEIDSVRLALIPKGNHKEVLAYEISAEGNDGRYFIYVNAQDGEEEEIFKVVSTSQGDLLV